MDSESDSESDFSTVGEDVIDEQYDESIENDTVDYTMPDWQEPEEQNELYLSDTFTQIIEADYDNICQTRRADLEWQETIYNYFILKTFT